MSPILYISCREASRISVFRSQHLCNMATAWRRAWRRHRVCRQGEPAARSARENKRKLFSLGAAAVAAYPGGRGAPRNNRHQRKKAMAKPKREKSSAGHRKIWRHGDAASALTRVSSWRKESARKVMRFTRWPGLKKLAWHGR